MKETQPLFTVDEESELIPLLNEGKVILFLGAGFSVKAKNKNGKTIPTATTLAAQMNQILIANGEKGFQGNNLYDLKLVSESFYRLNKEFPKAIDTFFRTNLTVDRDSIPSNYNNIKKINWNGVYTTNYDDLLEAIYKSQIKSKAAVKSTYKRTDSDLPSDKDFNIVYLNGDLNCDARLDTSNNVVVTDIICSITDFTTSSVPLGWFNFIDKFRQYPIIIVGSRLAEESFYLVFGELINKTNILSNQRPKSYIINMEVADQKYVELKNTYNLHHKHADIDKFLDWLGRNTELINLEQRITFSNNKPKQNTFIEFTKEYWENLKGKKSTEDLMKYYTNINSSHSLLPYVVADEFYIEPNEELEIKSVSSVKVNLGALLPKETGNHNSIIRINANGGTGKSTLLQHIGKKYFEKYHILYFKEITNTITDFPYYADDRFPVIILLDNYGKQLDKLKKFSQSLNELYFERGYCLIITERHIRESILDSEIKKEIDENFSDVKNCTIIPGSAFYEKIFDKIIQFVDKENLLSDQKRTDLRARLADKSKATTAERIIDFLISIKHSNLGFQFSFDWEDWGKLCEENADLKSYSKLYSIVAAFNNYDITPPIKFCIDLLGINDPNLVKTYSLFSEPNFDFPISIQKDKCFELRNPNLAEWYIKEKDSHGSLTKKYFKDALGEKKTQDQLYFLRNTYRNRYVLRQFDLRALIPDSEELLKLFKAHIIANPFDIDNSKNKMEMVVINVKKQSIEEAKGLLYEMISDSPKDIHPRTMLADILIREQEYEKAKPIVNYLTEIDPANNYIIKLRIAVLKHSADEVSVIKELLRDLPKENTANLKYLYAKLAKALRIAGDLIEAQEYCNKLLELNPSDYAAMNTLAMIYQKQNKFIEAEELLLKSIDIQPYNSHNYNELGQVYLQRYDETGNIEAKYKACTTFIKGLRISKDNIPLRTEFARFLIYYCHKITFAKNILLFNIQKVPNHFHSYTELGKLYQKQSLFQKSTEILEEGRKHIINGVVKAENLPMLVVLGNSYLELNEFEKAEEAFQKTIDLKQNNWSSHIGVAKAFLKQDKMLAYENKVANIIAGVTDLDSVCDFATWLKWNNKIEDSLKMISKAIELNNNNPSIYINTIHAGILLEKILYYKTIDSLETIKINGLCEKICLETLCSSPNHEQSIHILYRLNLHFRDRAKENPFLRGNYSKKYKKYLGKLFLLNRRSQYVFDGITQHLKTTRRSRLAIAFVKKYGDINLNPYVYVKKLTTFFGLLQNKSELESLNAFATENKFNVPNINLFENTEMLSQDNTGYLMNDIIKCGSKVYTISAVNRNVNYTAEGLSRQSTDGIKVFFGLYKINDVIVANCIEPFFDSIPENDSVLQLFELNTENIQSS
jgi:tetratricopeptide (TPR) repeat protein